MAISNSQFDEIMRLYEEKQYRNRSKQKKAQEYVYSRIPDYKKICDKLSSLYVEQGKCLLDDNTASLNSLKKSIADLQHQKKDLLKEAGLSEDFLEPVYDCADCKDTGYIGNDKCHCLRQYIIKILYAQSQLEEMLEENCFEHLSYEFYEGEDLKRFRNVERLCHNFIDSFDSDYHNLLFYGKVGTGKSFLSHCIAKELMKQEHSVIYFSAADLFDRISLYSYDHSAKNDLSDLFEDIYSCDLLIVDDLGTELGNTFSVSHFFSILNQRILRKKATIISTNLELQELSDRYSDRVFSRIFSSFDLCKLTGPDIRIIKKRQNNRK